MAQDEPVTCRCCEISSLSCHLQAALSCSSLVTWLKIPPDTWRVLSGHFGFLWVSKVSGDLEQLLASPFRSVLSQKRGMQEPNGHGVIIIWSFCIIFGMPGCPPIPEQSRMAGMAIMSQTKELCRIYSAPRPWLVMMSTIGLRKLKPGWWGVLG